MATRRARPKAIERFEIRPARDEDVRALGRLGAELARWHHALDPSRFMLPEGIDDGYAWWLGKERRSRTAVVLAAIAPPGEDGRVVGLAYGRLEGRNWNTLLDRSGEAVDLIVAPEVRGAGIGRALLEALVAELVARGAPRIVLHVAHRNPAARRLFRALGFRPTMLEMTKDVPAAAPGAGARRRSPRARR